MAFLRDALGVQPLFVSLYAAAVLPALALIAGILTWQAHAFFSIRRALLAAAFVYATPIALATILSLPVVGAVPTRAQGSLGEGFYLLWHLGWLAIIAVYAWWPDRRGSIDQVRAIVGGALLAALVAIVVLWSVPPDLVDASGHYRFAVWPGSVAVALVAVSVVGLCRRRRRLLIDRALLVALPLMLVTAALHALSAERFAAGVYLARALGAAILLWLFGVVAREYTLSLRRWVLSKPIIGGELQLEPAWRFVTDDASTAAPARASFTSYLRNRGLEQGAVDAAELIFGELVSNVVRHAAGPIEVEVFWDREGCRLIVRDRGPGFIARASLPEPYAESGRGLFLITLFGGLTTVERRPGGGSEVTVVFAPTAAVTLHA